VKMAKTRRRSIGAQRAGSVPKAFMGGNFGNSRIIKSARKSKPGKWMQGVF